MMKGFSSLSPMKAEFDLFFGADFFHWPERHLELAAGRICRIEKDHGGYRFSLPIPGIDRRSISIDVAASTVIVRGKHSACRGSETYFERFFLIPDDADIELIEASITGSHLTLRMPQYVDSTENPWEATTPAPPQFPG